MRFLPLAVVMAVCPVANCQSAAIPQKESLSYSIEWRLITAGKARLDWSALPGSRAGWEARLHVESGGLVSKLFKVEDDYTALLNQALCAQSVQMTTTEGIRHRETRVSFDIDSKKATYFERDRIKNTTLLSKEIETPGCVHDVVGGIYFLRTLNLEPGQAVQAPVSDGKRAASARIEAQQREDVKTPAGNFKTVRYELF